MTWVTSEQFAGIYVYHDRKPGQTMNSFPSIEPVFCVKFENAKLYGPGYNSKDSRCEYWNLMINGDNIIYRRNSKRHFRIYAQGILEDFRKLLTDKNCIGPGYFYGRVQGRYKGDGEYNWQQGPVRIELGTGQDRKLLFRKNGTFKWMKWNDYEKFDSRVAALRIDKKLAIENATDNSAHEIAHENYFVGVEKAMAKILGINTDRPCGQPCEGTGGCQHNSTFLKLEYIDPFNWGKAVCPVKYYANIDAKEQAGCPECDYNKMCDYDEMGVCEKYKDVIKAKEIAQKIIDNAKRKNRV